MRTSLFAPLVAVALLCSLEACGNDGGGGGVDAGRPAVDAGDGSSSGLDGGSSHDASEPNDASQTMDASADDASADDASGAEDASADDASADDASADDASADDAGTDAAVEPELEVVVCESLAAGPCTVSAGDSGRVLQGTVLTPTTIYRGGRVVVNAQGTIVQVGCASDCDADAACDEVAASATRVTCPSGVISPGLINTHDHITFAQNLPYTDTGERYEHRHDWRRGLNEHTTISVSGSASADQIRWGELRFVLGGATSTVSSGGQLGLLRNLDNSNLEEGLDQPAVDLDSFPLNDSSPPSGYPDALACSAFSAVTHEDQLAGTDAFAPHVAEGINAYAQNELTCMSDENPGHNLLDDKSAFISATGLTAVQYAAMGAHGTALIWSPRSNLTLFGVTATVTAAARLGVSIALGTDWLPTGSMNLLRELRCADAYNQTYLDGFFSDRELWLMVTANAAAATATDDVLGTLQAGKVADIAIFDGSAHADYRAVIDAEPQDVQLVLRAGKVLYGDASIVAAMPSSDSCDALDVCDTAKQVCLQSEVGRSLDTLQAAVSGSYSAFFCGEPMNEPSCTPSRLAAADGSTIFTGAITTDDTDGDGIPNAQDDCPVVFNPIRPLDDGVQPDVDNDGVGDACDPCPLDADTAECSTTDPNDLDGDGAANAADNCPGVQNDQTDTDDDDKGDACDACPMDSNPGEAACPATIYAIKDGTVPVGSAVALSDRLVTARNAQGFFLQVTPSDADYVSEDFSGIYVASPNNTVAVGDRATIVRARVTDVFGRITLTRPITTVVSSLGEALPAPVLVLDAAEVATDGTRAATLEGVRVQVADVTVTSIDPPLGSGDVAPSNELVVDDVLRVDDLLYLATPFPMLGEQYASITGVLAHLHGDSKLEPTGADDLVLAMPTLAAFGPAQSYVYVAESGVPTIPTPLTVTLMDPAPTSTFVSIGSGDPQHLTVLGGGVTVLEGETTAQVLLSADAAPADVVLTAALGDSMLTANVRIVDPSEQPIVASLSPPTARLAAAGTVQLTVTLDIPAPAGGALVLLALTPSEAGALPPSVTVPAGQVSASFDYVDGSTASSMVVTATFGASMQDASLTVGTVCSGSDLVLSEIRTRGLGGASDELVELYNPTSSPITLDSTWTLDARSHTAPSYGVRWVGTGQSIPAHGHFLLAAAGYTQQPAADEALSFGITDASSVRLVHSGNVVDAVCFGYDDNSKTPLTTDPTYSCEGTPATNAHDNSTMTNTDASLERKPGAEAGNCLDTGDNASDFATLTPANPQSSTSPITE